ncbi:RNA polymerase sigma factor [Chitinophaga defluvii]|uniref:RNA polymerase sigma-70 factor n=1 Tax=Chitinophaga defluvii TaxID=3163343 RepID=A0ABV2TBK7_9BACT
MLRYSALDEKELMCRLREHDEVAFTEIYSRYWKMLFGIAYNRLKDMATAEDIVHDVLTLVWQKRLELAPDNLPAYLAAAVKFSVLAHLRKKMSARNYILQSTAEITTTPHPDVVLHHKRILQMVREEVEKLPEKCRLIFKDSREQGLTTAEIAEKFNISGKTVENQLNKALRHLKSSFRSLFLLLLLLFFQP